LNLFKAFRLFWLR